MLIANLLSISNVISKNCTSHDGSLFIDKGALVKQQRRHSCPLNYHLARLDNPGDWEKAVEFTTACLGYNTAVWIAGGLGFRGKGTEQWILVTPSHANGNQPNTPLPDLPQFVQNRRGKLAINLTSYRRLASLCAKNSTGQ